MLDSGLFRVACKLRRCDRRVRQRGLIAVTASGVAVTPGLARARNRVTGQGAPSMRTSAVRPVADNVSMRRRVNRGSPKKRPSHSEVVRVTRPGFPGRPAGSAAIRSRACPTKGIRGLKSRRKAASVLHGTRGKNRKAPQLIENVGGAERDRTADLLNAIQALSQLSYSPVPRFARKGAREGGGI